MLDWDDLRFFLAVARGGTLSAAARTLGVTQPTVGRRVSAFERSLGARLFVRTPAGPVLSPTGRKMLAHAERIELDALAAERLAAGRDAGLRGRVSVTASEWLIDRALAPMVALFLEKNPGLELDLLADARHMSLVRREADVAIRPSKFVHQDVVQREVAAVAFGLYASDGYLAKHGPPDFARLCEGHAWVAMSESLGTMPETDWLATTAPKARVAARANGRVAMAALAAAGVGIACLPRLLGDASPQLRLVATPTPGPERKLWLGVHRDARAVPRLEATIRWLVEGFSRLRPWLRPAAP